MRGYLSAWEKHVDRGEEAKAAQPGWQTGLANRAGKPGWQTGLAKPAGAARTDS